MEATKEEPVRATDEHIGEEPPSCATSPSSPSVFSSPAVLLLILANVAVFLVLPFLAKDYPHNPIRMGALTRYLAFSGEWWRFITAEFVHIELFHLLFNMAALWILGKRMERLLGSVGVLAFYFGCGLVGDLTLLVLYPEKISFGASLPITGLAGALLVTYAVRFRILSKLTKWKFVCLLLVVAGLVRRELFDTHLFPHTIGLVIGVIFAVLLTVAARNKGYLTVSCR